MSEAKGLWLKLRDFEKVLNLNILFSFFTTIYFKITVIILILSPSPKFRKKQLRTVLQYFRLTYFKNILA